MPAETWQPPKTGNALLDQSLVELANRLTGIDAAVSAVAVPGVEVAVRSLTLTTQSYVEWRGGVGSIVLPDAAFRGTGRGSLITVQNFGTGTVTVKAPAKNSINGAAELTIDVNSGGLFSGNGVSKWSAIKPGGGHIIANGGTPLTDRPTLNFTGQAVASDNPGSNRTDVTVNVTVPAWYSNSFLSGGWYIPGHPIAHAATGRLMYGSTTTAGIQWAIPFVFGKAGTLTDLATYGSGQGGTQNKVYIAVYRSNAARTAPDSRIFSVEHTHTNFAHTKVEANSLGISVSADEILWFVATANGCAVIGVNALNLYPVLGTNFDGTGGAAPLRDLIVGYRAVVAYAQPPATWTATTKLLQSQNEAGGNQCAMPFFKFTPS